MREIMVALALVAAAGGGPLRAAETATFLPKEGKVLTKGQRMMCWTGDQVRLTASVAVNPIPPMKTILARGTGDPLKFEYERQHRRNRELDGLQLGTVGKGVLTEVIYNKGSDQVKKNHAPGQKGGSLLQNLFR